MHSSQHQYYLILIYNPLYFPMWERIIETARVYNVGMSQYIYVTRYPLVVIGYIV